MDNLLFIEFDHYLVTTNHTFLNKLATFYCNIWRFDPNFAEYRKCPNCEHYFSYNYVERDGNHSCPDCNVAFVEAWVEEEVASTIVELTSLGKNFFGAVAIDTISDSIVGFVWGFNKSLQKVETSTVLEAVQNQSGSVPYFNEIATDTSYRRSGIGSQLCRMLVEWMKNTFPHISGYLHTHEKSPARRLFEKAGYRFLCYDEKLGGERIFMTINSCGDFTPENL